MAAITSSPNTSQDEEIENCVEDLNSMDYAHLDNEDEESQDHDRIEMKYNDLEEPSKEELLHLAKREFHNGRKIWIKQLPHDTTQEEVEYALEIGIRQCEIDTSTSTALVTPEHAEDCETIMERGLSHKFQDNEVTLSLTVNDNLLCVAHLPFIYTDEDLMKLVQSFGPISRCFLMRSDTSGQSKGYGFVGYTTKEVANQARVLLDGKKLGTCTLQCDWLNHSHTTFSSLHSKCLFVDHLPSDYRDIAEFRKIFSAVVNPPYCQIAMKNGNPVGFGLVEFDFPHEAEETQALVNGHQIGKHKIRVTYCIPGIAAMVVYTKLTATLSMGSGRPGLLPAPPVNLNMLNNLQMLAMQNNPQLFQSLQTQLHLLSKNSSGNRNNAGKAGLLGNAPVNPFNANNNNPAALVALMASQMQMQLGSQQQQSQQQQNKQPQSLLGNPQLLLNLQNLIRQQMNNNTTASQKPSLLGNPAANLLAAQQALLDAQQFQNQTGMNNKSPQLQRSPLLGAESLQMPGFNKGGLLPHPNENSRHLMPNQHLNIQGNESLPNMPQGKMNFLLNESRSPQRGIQPQMRLGDAANLQSLLSLFNPNMGLVPPSPSNIQTNGTGLQNNNHMGVPLPLLKRPEQNLGRKQPLLSQPIASHLQHLQGLANPLLTMLLSKQQQNQQNGNNNIQRPSLLGIPNQNQHQLNNAPISPTSSKSPLLGEGPHNFSNKKPSLLGSHPGFSPNQQSHILNNPNSLGMQQMANFANPKPSLLGDFPPNIPDNRANMQSSQGNSHQKVSLLGDPPGRSRPADNSSMSRMGDSTGMPRSGDSSGMPRRQGLLGDAPPIYLNDGQENLEDERSGSHQGMLGYGESMGYDQYSMGNQYSPIDSGNDNSNDSSAAVAAAAAAAVGASLEQAQQVFCNLVRNITQSEHNPPGMGEANNAINLLELYQHHLHQWNNVCKTGRNISDLLAASMAISKCLENMNPRLLTPMGQKRAVSHVLPSPEPSPEGSYIGQHSQGLGGHYADSYIKRRKL